MPPVKRKRSESVTSEEWESDSGSSSAGELSDDDMDISSALTGKQARREPRSLDDIDIDDEDDDEDLTNFIKTSITKRDVKEGTQVVKKAKGKAKVAKGEVGGGSFQSMGTPTVF